MSPMRQLSGSVAERATQYRKGCQKHAMALSSRLNGLRYASILQADCYLSESDVEEIEAKQTTLGPHRASSLFLKKFQKLNDSVVCSFIEKTLLKDGRTDVIRTLQCCQGPGVCEFGPEELHPGDSRTGRTARAVCSVYLCSGSAPKLVSSSLYAMPFGVIMHEADVYRGKMSDVKYTFT